MQFTGTTIGSGSYGTAEEVTIPGAICAAKRIHEIYLDPSKIPPSQIHKMSTQFSLSVCKCQLCQTPTHKNVLLTWDTYDHLTTIVFTTELEGPAHTTSLPTRTHSTTSSPVSENCSILCCRSQRLSPSSTAADWTTSRNNRRWFPTRQCSHSQTGCCGWPVQYPSLQLPPPSLAEVVLTLFLTPCSWFGCFFPSQPQPRPPGYTLDDSSAVYSPGGDIVDKDSPPSSTVGQGPQQFALQRRAHSQMLSMASSSTAQAHPPPPQHFRPPAQQPSNSHIHHNVPIIPSISGGQYNIGQRSSVNVSGQPGPHVPRPPQTQDMAAMLRENKYSTPIDKSHRRRHCEKPPLEGYIKPQQPDSKPASGSETTGWSSWELFISQSSCSA